jgi:hypothetical protein
MNRSINMRAAGLVLAVTAAISLPGVSFAQEEQCWDNTVADTPSILRLVTEPRGALLDVTGTQTIETETTVVFAVYGTGFVDEEDANLLKMGLTAVHLESGGSLPVSMAFDSEDSSGVMFLLSEDPAECDDEPFCTLSFDLLPIDCPAAPAPQS